MSKALGAIIGLVYAAAVVFIIDSFIRLLTL